MIRSLRNLLNWKVLLGGITFAVVVFAVLVGILWSSQGQGDDQAPATAILNIIKAPTETSPVVLSTLQPTLEPTSSQLPPPQGGTLAIGDYVQVSGTGGDGLRLHASAGVDSKVQYIALESEELVVKDGPADADGYTWWLLQNPYTDNAVGWGVANYLVRVQNP